MLYTFFYNLYKQLPDFSKNILVFTLSATEGSLAYYFAISVGILKESLHAGFVAFFAAVCGGVGGLIVKVIYEKFIEKVKKLKK